MKTEEQILDKIKEHENYINILLKDGLDDASVETIERLLIGRKALTWVLSENKLLRGDDQYEGTVEYEITCYESIKIF